MTGFALADNNDQDQQLQQDEPAKSLQYGYGGFGRYGGYREYGRGNGRYNGYFAGYRGYEGYGRGQGRFGEHDQDQQLQQDEPAKSLRYGYRGYGRFGGYYGGYRGYYGGYGGGLGRYGEYRLGPVYVPDVEQPDSRSLLYARYDYRPY